MRRCRGQCERPRSVGDAEQQVRDRHLAPGRLRQERDGERERPTGLDQEVVEVGHDDGAEERRV
jgi:hypothetical protein